MTSRLAREIRQTRPFLSRGEEAFLNLQRTAARLQQSLAAVLKPAGLTPTQYNVLRILRGSHPRGLTCGEIGERMVTPVPDVTRMLDRLAARRLVTRDRAAHDRRVVEARITRRGRVRLGRLDAVIEDWLETRFGGMKDRELSRLIRLLEQLRE